jgi:hypothetical protein
MKDKTSGGVVKITSDDSSPMWIVGAITLLAILLLAGIVMAILGWSGAFSLHVRPSPAELAEGSVIQMMAPKATAQALEIERESSTRSLETKAQLENIFVLAVGAGLTVGAGYLVIVSTLAAGRALRTSRLPAVKRIFESLVMIETPAGPMLIDLMSGRCALLRDAESLGRLRPGAERAERPEGAGFEALKPKETTAPSYNRWGK